MIAGLPRADRALPWGMALLAIAAATLVVLLPAWLGAALIAGGGFVLLCVRYPLVALGFAVFAGPSKAFITFAYPWLDLGQLGLALFLGVWLLQRLSERDLRVAWVPVGVPLLLYILVGLASLWGAPDTRAGLEEVLKWTQVLAVTLIAADYARRGQLHWLVVIALASGCFQAAIGVWQYDIRGTGPEPFSIGPGRYRAYGTFEQPNPYGGFLGMVWPLAAGIALGWLAHLWQHSLAGGWQQLVERARAIPLRWLVALALSGLVAVSALFSLFISYSRGAWLGAAAAAAAMLVFWPRQRWLGVGLAVGGLAGLGLLWQLGLLPQSVINRLADVGDFVQVYDVRGVHINDSNFSLIERIAHWQAALAMADADPLLGAGLGNYDAAYDSVRLINWRWSLGHAHNIYLNSLGETGLLGLATYAVIWVTILTLTLQALRCYHGWRWGAALGLLGVWAHLSVHHLVDNLFVNNLHLYFAILLGILSAFPRISEQDHDPDSTGTAVHH